MIRFIAAALGAFFKTRNKAEEESREMGFFEHLEELRQMLFRCLLAFAVAMGLSFYYAKEIFAFMRRPLDAAIAHNAQLQAQAAAEQAGGAGDPLGAIGAIAGIIFYGDVPASGASAVAPASILAGDGVSVLKFMDVFTILMNIGMLGGITLSSPFVIYFVSKFVAPALTPREKKAVIPFCVASLLLFVAGGLFSFFYIMPITVEVMFHFNEWLGLRMNWLASDYYGLVTMMTLMISFTFEFPLIIIVILYLEVVEIGTLLRNWKYVFGGVFFGTLIITPVADPVSLATLTGVLFGLYMVGVAVGGFLVNRKKRRREKEEAEYEKTYRETGADAEKTKPDIEMK